MSVQQVDDKGCLWFLSPADSHKNAELAADSSSNSTSRDLLIRIFCN